MRSAFSAAQSAPRMLRKWDQREHEHFVYWDTGLGKKLLGIETEANPKCKRAENGQPLRANGSFKTLLYLGISLAIVSLFLVSLLFMQVSHSGSPDERVAHFRLTQPFPPTSGM